MSTNNIYRRRVIVNRFNLVMSLATMAFGMLFLLWILFVLFRNGLAALSPTLFVQTTPPPGSAGGLSNAIFGSVAIVAVATLVSTPIGILAGIYLAEFGQSNSLAAVIANEFGEAQGVHRSALFACGLVLFVLTLIVNGFARGFVVRAGRRSAGPPRAERHISTAATAALEADTAAGA